MALDPLTAALNIGGQLIERIFPDPVERDKAKLALLQLQQSGELAQIAVNQEEAKSSSVWVAGWRPAIGWICGAACAWNWVLLPVSKIGFQLFGISVQLAPADLSEMMPVLMGMLGLGALRTVERINGVIPKGQ